MPQELPIGDYGALEKSSVLNTLSHGFASSGRDPEEIPEGIIKLQEAVKNSIALDIHKGLYFQDFQLDQYFIALTRFDPREIEPFTADDIENLHSMDVSTRKTELMAVKEQMSFFYLLYGYLVVFLESSEREGLVVRKSLGLEFGEDFGSVFRDFLEENKSKVTGNLDLDPGNRQLRALENTLDILLRISQEVQDQVFQVIASNQALSGKDLDTYVFNSEVVATAAE